MSKNKQILLALLKGGSSQDAIAAALHVSKRDVSAAAKAVSNHGLGFADVMAMDASAIDDTFFPKRQAGRKKDDAYLQPDMEDLIERKKRNRKLPVKLMWGEYVFGKRKIDILACRFSTLWQRDRFWRLPLVELTFSNSGNFI